MVKAAKVLVLWIFLFSFLHLLSYWRWIFFYFQNGGLVSAVGYAYKLLYLEDITLLLLRLIFSLAVTLNILALIDLFKNRYGTLKTHSITTFFLTIVGILTSGCLGCAVSLFLPLLNLIGLSAVLYSLPYQGREVLGVSTVFLFLNALYLRKESAKGLHC